MAPLVLMGNGKGGVRKNEVECFRRVKSVGREVRMKLRVTETRKVPLPYVRD
jgi:hypothetical protein